MKFLKTKFFELVHFSRWRSHIYRPLFSTKEKLVDYIISEECDYNGEISQDETKRIIENIRSEVDNWNQEELGLSEIELIIVRREIK